MQKIQSILFISLLLFGGVGEAMAQSDEAIGPPSYGNRTPYKARKVSHSRSNSKATLSLTSANPFFDDFSSGTIPDSMFWDLKANPDEPLYPHLTIRGAVEPPSLGVATFDGASPLNRPYDNIRAQGPADRLESHYIDLTGADAGDNILLTFFLQPQGRGHAPEPQDSFKVYLNTVSGVACVQKLETVYTQIGSEVIPFRQVSIPINNTKYFHEEFFIVFESVGFLNGAYSHWHLDYVKMGKGRPAADTFYQDRSVCYLTRPPMDPYTAIPFQQYVENTLMKPFGVVTSNLKSNNENVGILSTISDPVGGNLTSNYTTNGSSSVSSYSHENISLPAIVDNQMLANPDATTFRNEISLTSSDDVSQNDSFTESYRIDTVFAYDDGEADFPYGIYRSRGFGQQFEIVSEDSIIAVWMCFAPKIDFSRGKTMEEAAFRFAIWNKPHPDSVYYRQSADMEVNYGDKPNYFHRYKLNRAVSLKPGTYWMGIIQFTDEPIGIGMDRSYDNSSLVFRDSIGFWVNTVVDGSLMIRPEMRNIQHNPGPFVPIETLSASVNGEFRVSPNPVSNGIFRLTYSGALQPVEMKLNLVDIQGKVAWQSESSSVDLKFTDFSCPNLSPGIYFLRIEGTFQNGKPFRSVKKLVIKS